MTAIAAPANVSKDKGLSIPFWLVHVACVLVCFTGISWSAVGICLAMYWIRMFGITAGYHRYFAHRSFKTSRAFQFVLAVIGTAAVQKGVLWWAANHRNHTGTPTSRRTCTRRCSAGSGGRMSVGY